MKTRWKKIIAIMPAIIPGVIFAQTNEPQTNGANPLLWLLIILIILLAFAITVLAAAVRNISDVSNRKEQDAKKESSTGKVAGAVILFFLTQQFAFAGYPAAKSGAEDIGGIPFGQFYFLVAIIAIELAFLFTLLNVLKLRFRSEAKVQRAAKQQKEKTILEKINASVEIEKEHDILLDHDYDGIQELDNSLPPWWKYGFYLSIIVAIAYMIHYHVAKTGDLQVAELEKKIATENVKIDEYLKNSSNNVDERTITFLNNPTDIAAGKDIFSGPCASCHGIDGQGGIGPNLTDDYWLHGGSIVDIFKSIKYGWEDKGMRSWKDDLSPMKMAQVTSFIKSIRGTNPPNAKDKEGDLFTEGTAAPPPPPVDSLKSDSIK